MRAKCNPVTGLTIPLVALALFVALGCSRTTGAAKPADSPEVEVAMVEQRDVPIYGEWIGTLDGMVNADIKAQVTGYLIKQDYTEGSFVKKGQLLFEIDARPFEAALNQAKGQLAQANGQLAQAKAQLLQSEAQLAVAQANQGRTQLDVNRYAPLAKQQAITQEDLDNATQNNLASKAQVQAARAAVETARAQIQAANATVSGRSGLSRNGAVECRLHASYFAHRWDCWNRPATGGRACQSEQWSGYYGIDSRSSKGLFHGG
jgi:membrane fusion protein (multidrug efflux system)